MRLRTGTIPDGYRDPDFVGARIIGALARRPRLALAEADAPTLHAFLPALAARVTSEAPSLVDAVITGARRHSRAPGRDANGVQDADVVESDLGNPSCSTRAIASFAHAGR
jgi:hypothetical protein